MARTYIFLTPTKKKKRKEEKKLKKQVKKTDGGKIFANTCCHKLLAQKYLGSKFFWPLMH